MSTNRNYQSSTETRELPPVHEYQDAYHNIRHGVYNKDLSLEEWLHTSEEDIIDGNTATLNPYYTDGDEYRTNVDYPHGYYDSDSGLHIEFDHEFAMRKERPYIDNNGNPVEIPGRGSGGYRSMKNNVSVVMNIVIVLAVFIALMFATSM